MFLAQQPKKQKLEAPKIPQQKRRAYEPLCTAGTSSSSIDAGDDDAALSAGSTP